MTAASFLLLLLGVALLFAGGEALIRGAVDLSRRLGISPLVIGLTVVAFATSAPELAATLTASLQGLPDLAVGNVLGSNVANIGLILGLSALLQPLRAGARFLRREIPFMLAVTLLLYPLFLGGQVGRLEGLGLLVLLAGYLTVLLSSPEPPAVQEELEELARRPPASVWLSSLLVGGGLILLVVGAKSLVAGAVQIALALGVPDRVVGLTLVAVGTSLPELASSLAAARRGESDLVLGNVVGSNVFNVLCILGLTALARPLPVPAEAIQLDLWVVFAFSLVLVPFLLPDRRLGRVKGLGLLALYGLYGAWLFW